MLFWRKPWKGAGSQPLKAHNIKLLQSKPPVTYPNLYTYKLCKLSLLLRQNADTLRTCIREYPAYFLTTTHIIMRLRIAIGIFGTLLLTLLTCSCEKEVFQVRESNLYFSQKWSLEDLLDELSSIMDYVVDNEIHIDRIQEISQSDIVSLPEDPRTEVEVTVARRLNALHAQMNRVLDSSNQKEFTERVQRMSYQKARQITDQHRALRSNDRRIACLKAHDKRGEIATHGFALCVGKSGGSGWQGCYYVYTTAVIGSFNTLYDCINDLEK